MYSGAEISTYLMRHDFFRVLTSQEDADNYTILPGFLTAKNALLRLKKVLKQPSTAFQISIARSASSRISSQINANFCVSFGNVLKIP